MHMSIELKSVVDLIVFNSIILNTYIKINDINGKIDALRATFNWAFKNNYLHIKISTPYSLGRRKVNKLRIHGWRHRPTNR